MYMYVKAGNSHVTSIKPVEKQTLFRGLIQLALLQLYFNNSAHESFSLFCD